MALLPIFVLFEQALTDLLIAGANRTTIRSDTGGVLLDSSCGGSSFLLDTSAIRGVARTVAFSAGVTPGLGQRGFIAPVDANGAFGVREIMEEMKGGYVNLTEEAASLGGPGDASIHTDDEVQKRGWKTEYFAGNTVLFDIHTAVVQRSHAVCPIAVLRLKQMYMSSS